MPDSRPRGSSSEKRTTVGQGRRGHAVEQVLERERRLTFRPVDVAAIGLMELLGRVVEFA